MTDDRMRETIEQLKGFYNKPRDPKRIKTMMFLLWAAWAKEPDQRLGQLIANIANAPGNDPFYIEDDDMMQKLKEYIHAH